MNSRAQSPQTPYSNSREYMPEDEGVHLGMLDSVITESCHIYANHQHSEKPNRSKKLL